MVRLKSVVKRNGEEAPFDGKKIENAIAKAFLATGEVEVRDSRPPRHIFCIALSIRRRETPKIRCWITRSWSTVISGRKKTGE